METVDEIELLFSTPQPRQSQPSQKKVKEKRGETSSKEGERVVTLYVFAFSLPSKDLAWITHALKFNDATVEEKKVTWASISAILERGRLEVYKTLHELGFVESMVGWVHYKKPREKEVQTLRKIIVDTIDAAMLETNRQLTNPRITEKDREVLSRILDSLKERKRKALERFDVFPIRIRAVDALDILEDAKERLAIEIAKSAQKIKELQEELKKRREKRKQVLLNYYKDRYEKLSKKLEEWQKFLESLLSSSPTSN